MTVKTKDGLEVVMNAEELRHFGINTPEHLKSFICKLSDEKETVGFKTEE